MNNCEAHNADVTSGISKWRALMTQTMFRAWELASFKISWNGGIGRYCCYQIVPRRNGKDQGTFLDMSNSHVDSIKRAALYIHLCFHKKGLYKDVPDLSYIIFQQIAEASKCMVTVKELVYWPLLLCCWFNFHWMWYSCVFQTRLRLG